MYEEILKFWFEEIESAQWWKKDEDFDRALIARFSDIHARAARCELFDWRADPRGRLAEIIVLDQFSRNMFRGSPLSFAHDALALALAQVAVANKADEALSPVQRSFLYMPYMHSEDLADQDRAMALFEQAGLTDNLHWAKHHREIVSRFGRFPHRNAILGRQSTPEELAYLASDEAFKG